jgi:hypothetical protein
MVGAADVQTWDADLELTPAGLPRKAGSAATHAEIQFKQAAQYPWSTDKRLHTYLKKSKASHQQIVFRPWLVADFQCSHPIQEKPSA